MPTLDSTQLAAAVSTATGFISKRNAGTLLERVAALVAAGEAEERVLARLNGPARTAQLTDDPTPSRADAGMGALAEQQQRRERLEAARRTTVEELAGAVADRLDERLGDRLDRLDAELRRQVRELVGGTTVEQLAARDDASAVAAANAAAATTHDDGVPWETRPAASKLPTRQTQQDVLRVLHDQASTVQEVAAAVGVGPAGANSRLVHLLASGHVQRRLVAGRFVYRVHPNIAHLVPGPGSVGARLVRETIDAQAGMALNTPGAQRARLDG